MRLILVSYLFSIFVFGSIGNVGAKTKLDIDEDHLIFENDYCKLKIALIPDNLDAIKQNMKFFKMQGFDACLIIEKAYMPSQTSSNWKKESLSCFYNDNGIMRSLGEYKVKDRKKSKVVRRDDWYYCESMEKKRSRILYLIALL
jgi:hypothetical protein